MLEDLKCKLFGYSRRKNMKRKVTAISLLIFSLVAIPSFAKINAHLWNLRDLGGRETEDGQTTSYGLFLRSNAPIGLNDSEINNMIVNGVNTVIDLRTNEQMGQNFFNGEHYNDNSFYYDSKSFAYHNVQIKSPEAGLCFIDTYIHSIIEGQKESIKKVFDVISEEIKTKKGTVLINGSMGIERTGVISMLILGLAGVKKEEIAKDFADSYVHHPELINQFPRGSEGYNKKKKKFSEIIDYIEKNYNSEKIINCIRWDDSISTETYNYICKNYERFKNKNYKHFEWYLLSCGVKEEAIKNIKDRFSL